MAIDSLGDDSISCAFGTLKEHAPYAHYQYTSTNIPASFSVSGSNETFNIGTFDTTRTLVIDPWVTNPNFQSFNSAYNVDYDNAGNVYVYGGAGTSGNAFELVQLSSTGAINWVFQAVKMSPILGAGTNYGDFTVDKVNKISYIVQAVEPVNPTGSIYAVSASGAATLQTPTINSGPTSTGGMNEMWKARFDQCTGNVIIGGGGYYSTSRSLPCNEAAVYNPSANTLNLVNVLGLPNADGFQDICLMALDPSSKTSFMATSASNGSPSVLVPNSIFSNHLPNLTAYATGINDAFPFAEEQSVMYVDNNSPPRATNNFNGMAASPKYLYVTDGLNLTVFDKVGSGTSFLNQMATKQFSPSGSFQFTYGGIDVDACDNIYVGAAKAVNVYKYNAGFTNVTSYATPGNVYDVKLGVDQQNMYACGAAFVQSSDVSSTSNVSVSFSNTSTCGTGCTGASTATLSLCGTTVTTSTYPGLTYLWSPGNQTTQTVTGLCAGTYTVTISLGGCTGFYTGTTIISSLPSPTVTISAGGSTSFCAGGSVGLTASGASTYIWSPTTGLSTSTGATVTAGPTTNITYTATGTSTAGCVGTNIITISADPTCCSTVGAVYTFSNTTISGTYGPTSSLIVISGTCTVSTSGATFAGCSNVQVAAGATITVPPNATLNITNSGTDISRLYACGNMWQGIIVDPDVSSPGHLYISGGSIIEDAIQAIYTPTVSSSQIAPTISVVNSTLNNNYTDIYIDGYTSTTSLFPLTLQGDSLTTSTDGTYSGPYLKSPYSGAITNTGVYINAVPDHGVVIGTLASGSTNTFSTMKYGVYGHDANFYVYNNIFWNMHGAPPMACPRPPAICPQPPIIGEGVVATGPTGSSTYGVVVGGGASYETNWFRNVNRGVDLNNYKFVMVDNNIFGNTTNNPITANQLGDHGVYIKTNKATTLEVDSNNFINFETGVHLNRTYTTYSTTIEHIDYNNLSITSGSGMNTGIIVENATRSTFAPTVINFNTVHDASNCIWVRNFLNQRTLIDSNNDLRVAKIIGTKGTQRSGIRVEYSVGGGQTLRIEDNTIYTNGTYLSTTAVPADTEVIGINVIYGPALTILCNDIYDVGECMRFSDFCPSEGIYSNSFNTAGPSYDGLVLWNNAQLGSLGRSGVPTGNEWTTGGTFLRSKTYAFHANAQYSPLWVTSGATTDPAPNLGFPTSFAYGYISGTINITTGSTPSCSTICPICINNHDPILDSVALDSVHYDIYPSYAREINRNLVFDNVATYDTLRTGDTILNNFYNANLSTNIGALYQINNYISQGYYSEANTILATFSPSDSIERNYKTADSIFTYTIGAGVDTLDSLDLVHLYNIAYQCPDMGGVAVYQARSMLNLLTNMEWDFSDSCNTSGGREGRRADKPPVNNPTSVANLNARVYPDPANTLLNIEIKLPAGNAYNMCMYNSLGEKVICEELTEPITILPINTLLTGIYFYRIIDESGKLIKADKVMIMH